ncbi:unnamed protein product [Calicophoron daubneyi]|uniref:Tyrosine-protein kinase ephrin type A/B receptor-like domain-containing protein n=1 Tax=Calicophoron daubneyi TaxID=300641 RepID=A0AAV2T3B6_CALDB
MRWKMRAVSRKLVLRTFLWLCLVRPSSLVGSTGSKCTDEDFQKDMERTKRTVVTATTGLLPPIPQSVHLWPTETTVLAHKLKMPTSPNKVWLYQPEDSAESEAHYVDSAFHCIEIGTKREETISTETYWLTTGKSGTYWFTEYENGTMGKSTQEKGELYVVLATFIVSAMKPASIGLTLRVTSYEPRIDCKGSDGKVKWVLNALQSIRMFRSVRIDKAMLDGDLSESEIVKSECYPLPDDDYPLQIMAYYNIDRARIAPGGILVDDERPWNLKAEVPDGIEIKKSATIKLPHPFGGGTRIRLSNFNLPPDIGLQFELKTRSEEGESEGFWGPGMVDPPFPDEQVLPYDFATVTLDDKTLRKYCADENDHIEWMLIEPYYGRIRTATGYLIAMNVKDKWINGEFLTELVVRLLGNENHTMVIPKISFEVPAHPEDIYEIIQVLRAPHPLPGATPKWGRACLSTEHGFSTSSYYINLRHPKECIDLDDKKYNVRKKTGGPRSGLISYSIRMLYDDFGYELEDAKGFVTGHIQMVSYSRQAQQSDGHCLPRLTPTTGEIMRLGWLVDARTGDLQYLSRWEGFWVNHYPVNDSSFNINLDYLNRLGYSKTHCGPERTEMDFVYDLETHRLRVVANDTNSVLVNATLNKHPIWLGLEMFTDPTVECEGCFVYVHIDRRAVRHRYQMRRPMVNSATNDWHQIHFPRQADALALNIQTVKVIQTLPFRSAMLPSPANLQRRLLKLTRKLANPLGLSIAVLGAASICQPGQFMSYGTPAVCVNCPPGTKAMKYDQQSYFPVYLCEVCPIGTYQHKAGQPDCTPCKKGMTTPSKGSWTRKNCVPNVTEDVFVTKTRAILKSGEPYKMVELASESSEQTYDWTKDEEEEYQTMEGPSELNMVSTSRLVFNMIILVLLLGCIMAFVVTSKGYMLVWISDKARHRPSAYGTSGISISSLSSSNRPSLWKRLSSNMTRKISQKTNNQAEQSLTTAPQKTD